MYGRNKICIARVADKRVSPFYYFQTSATNHRDISPIRFRRHVSLVRNKIDVIFGDLINERVCTERKMFSVCDYN